MKRRISCFLFSLLMVASASAGDLRTFLLSSAYGTGIGALVGAASLAVKEDPAGNMNVIAKGASLGLYTGMAVGYYLATQPNSPPRDMAQPQLFFVPVAGGAEPEVHLAYTFPMP